MPEEVDAALPRAALSEKIVSLMGRMFLREQLRQNGRIDVREVIAFYSRLSLADGTGRDDVKEVVTGFRGFFGRSRHQGSPSQAGRMEDAT